MWLFLHTWPDSSRTFECELWRDLVIVLSPALEFRSSRVNRSDRIVKSLGDPISQTRRSCTGSERSEMFWIRVSAKPLNQNQKANASVRNGASVCMWVKRVNRNHRKSVNLNLQKIKIKTRIRMAANAWIGIIAKLSNLNHYQSLSKNCCNSRIWIITNRPESESWFWIITPSSFSFLRARLNLSRPTPPRV